eukprot:scaffold44705_cov70-Phaeocystis_antarctica.AAC.2
MDLTISLLPHRPPLDRGHRRPRGLCSCDKCDAFLPLEEVLWLTQLFEGDCGFDRAGKTACVSSRAAGGQGRRAARNAEGGVP